MTRISLPVGESVSVTWYCNCRRFISARYCRLVVFIHVFRIHFSLLNFPSNTYADIAPIFCFVIIIIIKYKINKKLDRLYHRRESTVTYGLRVDLTSFRRKMSEGILRNARSLLQTTSAKVAQPRDELIENTTFCTISCWHLYAF